MINTLFSLIQQVPPMFYILLVGLLLLTYSYIKEEKSIKGKTKLTFNDKSYGFDIREQEDEYEFWKNCECPARKEELHFKDKV